MASLLPPESAAAQGGPFDAVGLCFEGSDNPELDVHLCSLAIETSELRGRSLGTLHTRRGRALVELARFDRARSDFDRALELNPLSAAAHHGRGLALHASGAYAAAIRDFDAALDLSPSFVEALRSRGTTRLFQGDMAGAVRDFDAELRRVPLDEVGRILRGLAHYGDGQHAQAAEDLASATASRYPYRLLPLWLYLARARSGMDGRTELIDARAELGARDWPAILFDHYLGDGDAASVIAGLAELPASIKGERMIEAHLFLGELARLHGDPPAGRQHLSAAAAAEGGRSVEWAMAKALLARGER